MNTIEEYHKTCKQNRALYKESIKGNSEPYITAVNNGEIPSDTFFLRCPEVFSLWLNRKSDNPISYKEIYEVVKAIINKIGCTTYGLNPQP